ncbi:hypothetical protein AV521_45455 [Streptomyces sp. IMTB 2501]|uniref:GmrSD restriction endonuclease domain-containing protein n=1 Tax=Streptomyces sp. IMTB 2501 TaxID=1776340 RepID=UPI00096EA1EB|nr:DUF1524 domain-containing protein [Streptomyces sp. IMTB 2501]OLZ59384.1 hypothetical protein AV521_45455 [Streptomyces sp. IMTB 2501]
MDGYSHAKFPHWMKQYGECDTCEVVLSRDGQGVTQDSLCRAIARHLVSPYDDKTLGSASKVDIDHTVPLANAWRSGADTWTIDKRKKFANDLDISQLTAISASSNRSKGATPASPPGRLRLRRRRPGDSRLRALRGHHRHPQGGCTHERPPRAAQAPRVPASTPVTDTTTGLLLGAPSVTLAGIRIRKRAPTAAEALR